MRIKVAEASGPVLDWMVAKCEGEIAHVQFSPLASSKHYFAPSKKWAQGGPIIEREEIELHVLPSGLNIAAHPTYKPGDLWEANLWPVDFDIIQICAPTPLIAAMRCYVASKLGEEVEVPDELV